jgi:hypothetical protein
VQSGPRISYRYRSRRPRCGHCSRQCRRESGPGPDSTSRTSPLTKIFGHWLRPFRATGTGSRAATSVTSPRRGTTVTCRIVRIAASCGSVVLSIICTLLGRELTGSRQRRSNSLRSEMRAFECPHFSAFEAMPAAKAAADMRCRIAEVRPFFIDPTQLMRRRNGYRVLRHLSTVTAEDGCARNVRFAAIHDSSRLQRGVRAPE